MYLVSIDISLCHSLFLCRNFFLSFFSIALIEALVIMQVVERRMYVLSCRSIIAEVH